MRCAYTYDDGERCVYEDRQIARGEMCDVHKFIVRDLEVRRAQQARKRTRDREAKHEAMHG